MYAVIVAAGSRRVEREASAACRPRWRRPSSRRSRARCRGCRRPRCPRTRRGTTTRSAVCSLCRPHRVGAFAHVARHGAHRVLADRGDVRHDHEADHEAGAQHVEARQAGHELLQDRRHHQQREIAVDDRRHGAEQFQDRLDGFAQAMRGELGEVDRDRSCRAEWPPAARRMVTVERARHQRQDAVVRVVEQRRPHRVGQELPDRDVREEERRLVRRGSTTIASVVNTATSAGTSSRTSSMTRSRFLR